MRAITCHAWGDVDALVLENDVPTPTPEADEILIEVKATAINYADSIMVAGNYQTKPPFPFSPGLETAGVVTACGQDVTKIRPGDRVMAVLAYGGLAEYAVAKAAEAYVIPDDMSWQDAAAFPIAYFSSDVAIRWLGQLKASETMLVLGAAGGVGLTAVEIGKAIGARVIAAASTQEKLDAAKSRGADELINYSEENLKERVDALTSGDGVNVCFDPVGGELFDAALSSLGWGGRMLIIGFVGGVPKIPANRLLVKNRAAFGSSLRHFRWHEPDKLQITADSLLAWYGEGKLKPMVTHELPLERSADAIRLLTERKAYGRVLVTIGLND
ncbi:MAG: NADPH:quinone oxidoreductase family protein [Gammaproteobacteria bacterium]|nr:NADPH:quinone oxidoreductase family protein [Gammaproteobacteria bacterium]